MAGYLINGQWHTQDQFADDDGEFKRQETSFRETIDEDGFFKPEKDRYNLYVSYACPWAHRALIFRRLKQLVDIIDVSVVHPHMLDNGWELADDFDGATGDPLYNFDYLYQMYTKAKSDYTGKVTVPVLWDKKSETIVNNESADIIRIFNSAFNEITGDKEDYYPPALHDKIHAYNDRIYNTINNGVYKAGFATTQNAYEKSVNELFESLEWLERTLADGRAYLCGERMTEADIRLLTTLLRFDAVYHTHFKCNVKQLSDFKFLQTYMVRLYNQDFVKPTVHMDHIKHHYYYSHKNVNPSRIIPVGPDLDWL